MVMSSTETMPDALYLVHLSDLSPSPVHGFPFLLLSKWVWFKNYAQCSWNSPHPCFSTVIIFSVSYIANFPKYYWHKFLKDTWIYIYSKCYISIKNISFSVYLGLSRLGNHRVGPLMKNITFSPVLSHCGPKCLPCWPGDGPRP